MKILFCVKTMAMSGGGAERVLADIANSFCLKKGYHISLLTFDSEEFESFYKLSDKIKTKGLAIGEVQKKAGFFDGFHKILETRKQIKKIRPDIIISFNHSSFIFVGIAALGLNIPTIASEHIVTTHYKTRPLERILLELTPFLFNSITVVSEDVKNSFPKRFRRKMEAIHNPVIDIDSKKKSEKIVTENKTILNIGRLVEQKDHKTLISAFALVSNHLDGWKLRIIGDGHLKKEIENQISELNLKDRVELVSFSKDVSSEYLNADFFVLSSSYESFGLVIAESLAHKLPAIGFENCEGVNKLIKNNENGLLVSSKNDKVQNLSKAILQLAADKGLQSRLSFNCHLPEKHEIGYVINCWESLIEKISKRKREKIICS